MKNLFNFNIKSIVLGKARWLLTLFAIITLGVGQMWAGIYECKVTLNGTQKNVTDLKDVDWSTQTDLTLTSFYVKANKDGNNLWGNSYMGYNVNTGPTTTSDTELAANTGNNSPSNWFNNGYDHYGEWNGTVYLSRNRKPGNYKFTFWFKSQTGSSTWCWYSNDSKNFNVSYTIPDPTITITGAGSLVAGTSTNITASMSNYPAGATLTRVDVTGNIASSKYNTGSSSSITVSSVTPNASGTNGITVTVTVTFGSAGTKTYTYKYNVTPPAVSNYTLTPSGYISGNGTSGTPYLVTYNGTLTIGLSGATKAYDDGNASAQYSTNGGSTYGTTGTSISKSFSGVKATTNQSYTFKARLYNSTASLSGAVNEKTIYYKVPTSTITLNRNGGNNDGSATTNHGRNAFVITTAPTKTGYHVSGYYTNDATPVLVADASGNLQGSTAYTTSGSLWNVTTNPTLYAHWTANNYTVAFNANDAQYVGEATGSTASVAATYDADVTLTTNGFERAGYVFAGWATTAAGSKAYDDGETITKPNFVTTGTKTLYAKWTPNDYTVTYDAGTNGGYILGTTGDKPSTTTVVTIGNNYNTGTPAEVSVVPTGYRAGYIFEGWYTLPSGGTKVESTDQMTTPNNHTLYAHFTRRNYVYFYNNVNWTNVYVTYSAYWDDATDKGTGNWNKVYHQMTRLGTSNVYYDEIPAAILADWSGTNAWIAFDNTGFSATDGIGQYGNFTSGKVIHRRDFDSNATMFVPNSAAAKDFTKNGSADYYCTGLIADKQSETVKDYRYIDKGYWTRYDDNYTGYVLKGSWDAGHDYYFRRLYSDHADTSTVTLRLAASTNYTFMLYKHCTTDNFNNSWFSKSASPYTITSDACKDVVFNSNHAGNYNGDNQNVTITTTTAGDYTFKLICDKSGVLKMTVAYPPAPSTRDYRLVYTWNDGSAHTRVSEMKLIPNLAIRNIDMFIHKPSGVTSSSLKLQKYNGSAWADAYTYTLSDELIPTNGVYTFKIEGRDSDPICSAPESYNGAYYLRSDVTGGGWEYYRTATFGDNTMTYSAYSLTQTLSAPYSHYYCIWVNNTSTSVAYTIATENSPSICDTLTTDAIVTGASCHLPAKANVRFGWNEQTNALVRSYLKSAVEDNSRFLVLHGKADNMIFKSNGDAIPAAGDLAKNELQFEDKGDWVYEIALQAKPGAKACLIAKYGDTDRYLIGDGSSNWMDVLAGSGSDKYSLKGVYDFKTNRLMIAWTPGAGTINDVLSNFDMLWIRHAQQSANQINIGPSGSLTNVSVVAALEFRYNELIGQVSDWTSDSRPLMKFFVSFPFDVNVSDIFGLNGAEYGREYVVQKYNGAKRAEKGLYTMDPGFWEDLTVDSVMHKHEGYCIIMDNDYLNNASASIWEHKSAGSSIYLYLPASTKMNITGGEPTSTVYPHVGKDKEFGSGKNHNQTDSHWNMIGSPLFHDSYIKSSTNAESVSLPAYYTWNSSDNSWSAETTYARDHAYPAMSSFLVQWYGTITWSTVSSDPVPVAARRNNEPTGNYLAQIDLMYNGEAVDWAFVHMRDGASEDHVLCEELNKMTNSGKSNIYVFAGNYEVAYNQVPIANQTIPVGLIIKKNGTYTFSMPTNFSGTVTLIDTFAQTRTNLAFEDYEVTLQKGTINDRFLLEFDINNAPTAIDGAMGEGEGSLKDGKAHKFIQNGTMYILRDGVIYDAQGKKVE